MLRPTTKNFLLIFMIGFANAMEKVSMTDENEQILTKRALAFQSNEMSLKSALLTKRGTSDLTKNAIVDLRAKSECLICFYEKEPRNPHFWTKDCEMAHGPLCKRCLMKTLEYGNLKCPLCRVPIDKEIFLTKEEQKSREREMLKRKIRKVVLMILLVLIWLSPVTVICSLLIHHTIKKAEFSIAWYYETLTVPWSVVYGLFVARLIFTTPPLYNCCRCMRSLKKFLNWVHFFFFEPWISFILTLLYWGLFVRVAQELNGE